MNRVLITGGSGFIGAWIARRLAARGVAVRVFDLRVQHSLIDAIAPQAQVEYVTGDVALASAVLDAAQGCDLIIHLAAILTPECQADPILGAQVNFLGTLNVFEAARQLQHDKVLYMSSASVYGPDEGKVPAPVTQYGAFKLAGEASARAYWEDHRLASLGIRPLVVYGPGRETGLSAGPTLACCAAARGERYVIPYSGTTDYVYVDDVAAVFDRASDVSLAGASAHNLLGDVVPMDDFIARIVKLVPDAGISASGPEVPVAAVREDTGIRQLLGQLEKTDLDTGIASTIAFYRQ